MKHANAIRLTIAAAIIGIASAAQAGSKLEKVDMVSEGIDLKPAIVKANGNGYSGYGNSSHTYLLRLFAKAKGSNRVFYAGVGSASKAPLFSATAFQHTAGRSEGWGVYKKSISVPIDLNKTEWWTSPGAACNANLKAQMKKGQSKANVLKKEWKVTAAAKILFVAQADTKGHNKANSHDKGVSTGSRLIAYSVPVVCRAAG